MSPRLNTIRKKRSLTKSGVRWYFTIHAPNGERLERSQMYKTRAGRNKRVKRICESQRINVE